MVTALDDRDARMLGLNAGAEDFLTKPVDRAELCVRVRNLLRLKAYGDYYDKYSQMLEGEVGSRTADLVETDRSRPPFSPNRRRCSILRRTPSSCGTCTAGSCSGTAEPRSVRLAQHEALGKKTGLNC